MVQPAPVQRNWRLCFLQPDGSSLWATHAAAARGDHVVKARFKVTSDAALATTFPSKVAARAALMAWGRVLKKGEIAKATFVDPDAPSVVQGPPPAAAISKGLEKLVEDEKAFDASAEEELSDTYVQPSNAFSTRGSSWSSGNKADDKSGKNEKSEKKK